MLSIEMIRTLIVYHYALTRRAWDSMAQISEEQFLADETYSRGSIRNLMVHLANSDRRWLAGLKNQPEVGNVKFEDYFVHGLAVQTAEATTEYLHRHLRRELGLPEGQGKRIRGVIRPSRNWKTIARFSTCCTPSRNWACR